jgi:hypothetical protein
MRNRTQSRATATGIALAVVAILLLWCVSAAVAAPSHHQHQRYHQKHRRRHHRHHRVHHSPPGQGIAATGGGLDNAPVDPSSSSPAPVSQIWDNANALVALGNVPGCVYEGTDPVAYLQLYGAEVLRLVMTPGDPDTAADEVAVKCVAHAVAAGYKVSLVIGYDNAWSNKEILEYFDTILGIYGPYAWAISVGNEQELDRDGSQTGAEYASTWRAVEPVLAADYPQAIRVAGEISPWGLQFIQSALAIGLPGAQALAGHPYARPHAFAPIDLAALAQAYGLPVWYSEGLAAYNAWGASIPLWVMPDAAMAGIWLN